MATLKDLKETPLLLDEELRRRYNEGASLKELALELGVVHETLRRRFVRMGVPRRKRGPRPGHAHHKGRSTLHHHTSEAQSLYEDMNWTYREIAEKYGCTHQTVVNLARKAEWKTRPRGRRTVRRILPDAP